MRHKRIKHRIQRMPLRNIKTEEGSADLLQSPAMAPYLRLAVASVKGADIKPALTEIAALPLEQRYVWRIASALKWAFADFDTLNVAADRETLAREGKEKLTDLLRLRPIQFCLFLKALLGEDAMERKRLSNPSVPARDSMVEWERGRTIAGCEGEAPPESGGGRAADSGVRSQWAEPDRVLPKPSIESGDAGTIPEAAAGGVEFTRRMVMQGR